MCDRDGAHLAERAERAEPGVPGHPEQRGYDAAPPEGRVDVQLGDEDDPLRLKRVRVRVRVSEDWGRDEARERGMVSDDLMRIETTSHEATFGIQLQLHSVWTNPASSVKDCNSWIGVCAAPHAHPKTASRELATSLCTFSSFRSVA